MRHGLKISVVMPCYNEEEGVAECLRQMPDFVDEVVVVDNNSSDRTGEVAREGGARVVFEVRPGYGRAYKSGLSQATGDVVCTLDGDATYPVNAIPYLIDILVTDELDFISAWRIPADWQESFDYFLRYMGNRIFNLTIVLLYWFRLRDSQSGMWCFKRDVLERVNVTSDGMPFSEELKMEVFEKRRDIRAREVPVHFHYVKRRGESKLSLWKDGTRNFLFLFVRRFKKLFGVWRAVPPIAEEKPMSELPGERTA
jgi:glycosyltransferase involved in cell wall biosynthesis